MKKANLQGRAAPDVPGGPDLRIKKAGIEAWFNARATGWVKLSNMNVKDCDGDGVFAVATNNAKPQFFATRVDLSENGSSGAIAPFNSSSFSALTSSGLFLGVDEGASWTFVRIQESILNDNFAHGAFLHGRSYSDEPDAFFVEVDLSEFKRNGDPASSSQAHGFLAKMKDAKFVLEADRSQFSENHSSGFKFQTESNAGLYRPRLIGHKVAGSCRPL